MNIAELFVNLGIKGADKTVSTLGNVKKSMGELGSTSLEAKAAIVGAMYGLERMMAISGAAGTNLTNFSALTGLSAQGLQRWQFAARQAGVASEDLSGSLKGVQNSMTNMLMGKGAPEGIALLTKSVGGLDPTKFKDTFYMMTKLQEGIQKMSPEMGQMVGKSFGLSEGVVAAMRRNMFTPDMLKRAPVYSDKEIGSLDKSNIAWSNLSNKIQMAFGHFNAKHGQQLVNDISKLTTEVMKFADALTVLAEKFKIFQVIGDVFEGLTKAMRLMNGETVDQIQKGDTKKRHFGDGTWWMNMINGGVDAVNDVNVAQRTADLAAKGQWKLAHGQGQTSNTTTINQNITHIGDAKDTKGVKDTHKSAIQHAYRQRSAQRQGS